MNAWVYTAFVLFLLGHLWLFFRDRRMAAAKIASSLTLVGLIALLSASFATWLGWPAGRPMPGVKYAMIAVHIREPQPGRAGHIYAWLSTDTAQSSLNPFVHFEEPGSPRVFEILFTPESEKAMQRAAQALRQGRSVSAMFGDDSGTEGDDGDAGGIPGHGRGDPQHLNGRDGAAPKLFVDEPDGSAIPKR
ncbi:hypothetical protein SAMN05444161_6940 [Rhizobiales bacterium GAS191]|nr:hypothetical protein SAMN05519103_06257 [Rhizobiales bacterium GAS113]SEE74044.1 hypothetical protein SAMN05444161_6940 [Rhizobiales bacterium GAS191]